MPRVRVPIRRSGYRYTTRPGRRYPVRPVIAVQPAGGGGGRGLLGSLAALLLCLLCLATLGLLGLLAAFIAVTAHIGDIYRALRDAGNGASGLYINMAILLAALCFAGFHKLQRSL